MSDTPTPTRLQNRRKDHPVPAHNPTRPRPPAITVALLLALITAFAAAGPAHAGNYQVTDLGAWKPATNNPGVTTYPDNGLYVRNVLGDFSSPVNASGDWRFVAPAGTSTGASTISIGYRGGLSWQPLLSQGGIYFSCGGPTDGPCLGSSSVETNGSGDIVAQLRCADNNGCPNSGSTPRGEMRVFAATVTINDTSAPTVSIAGGSAATDGWIGGTETVNVAASDNVGIRQLTATVDGQQQAAGVTRQSCNDGAYVPCPNTSATGAEVTLNLNGVTEGAHILRGRALDSAGNAADSPDRAIKVDNKPPGKAENVVLDGGPGYRSANAFTVRWTNPAQEFAPIAGADYQLCPTGSSTGCVKGSATGDNLSALENITVPGPGPWTLQLALRDAAGNVSFGADNAVTIDGLGFDDSPPNVEVDPIDPRDPARVTVRATDGQSGLKTGSIEVRKRGAKTWRAISTRLTASGLTAVVPDRRLRRGRYRIRALVTNGAGLTAGAQRATLTKLPIRLVSRLTGGRPAGKKLKKVTSPRIGQRIKLRGRLTVKRKALSNRTIAMFARTTVQGAKYRPVGTVKTDKKGRYTVRLNPGPARTIKLVYAGGTNIADDQVKVQVRTRARIGLRVSDRRLRNGESTTFSGQVRGGSIPPSGAQVAIQYFARGKWRPASNVINTDADGRFSYPYRFETVAGKVRFRFRAVIVKGATYPYYGRSAAKPVDVRGL